MKMINMKNKNFIHSFSSNIFLAASKFIIVVIITKILGAEVLGVYSLTLSIVTPLFILVQLKSRTIVSTDTLNKFKLSDIFLLNTVSTFIGLIILILIGFLIPLNAVSLVIILILQGLIKCIENYSQLAYGYFQKNNKFGLISRSVYLHNSTHIISFIFAFLILKEELLLALSFSFIGSSIVFLKFDLPNLLRCEGKSGINVKSINKNEILTIAKKGIPFSLSSTISSFNSNIPRYYLGLIVSTFQVGIYSGLIYILTIGSLFVNSLSQTFISSLASFYDNHNFERFEKMIWKLNVVGGSAGILIVLIVTLLGDKILILLFNDDFLNYHLELIILSISLAILLGTVFFGTGLSAMKIFEYHLKITLIGLILSSAVGFIFIQRYKVTGAVLTVSFNQVLTSLLYYFYYKISIRKRKKFHAKELVK